MPRNPGIPRGRPPKPVEVKRLTGNPGGRPLPKAEVTLPSAAGMVPAAPEGLGPKGLKLWNDSWTWGGPWLSPALDAGMVEAACHLADEMAMLRPMVMEGPILVEPLFSANGEYQGEKKVANPAVKMLRQAEVAMRGMLSDLGFTPTARARLGVAQVKTATKLEELLAKQSSRNSGMATTVVDVAAT